MLRHKDEEFEAGLAYIVRPCAFFLFLFLGRKEEKAENKARRQAGKKEGGKERRKKEESV
jgi:hypothetical protein